MTVSGSASDAGSSYWVPGRSSEAENPNGPMKVLVENGKALNPQGRKLLCSRHLIGACRYRVGADIGNLGLWA